jgi:hypothetical protein
MAYASNSRDCLYCLAGVGCLIAVKEQRVRKTTGRQDANIPSGEDNHRLALISLLLFLIINRSSFLTQGFLLLVIVRLVVQNGR